MKVKIAVLLTLLSLMTCRDAYATSLSDCCQLTTTNEICNNTCVEVLSEFTSSSLATLSSTEIQALSSACSPTYSDFWTCINRSVSTVDPTPIHVNYTTDAVTTSQPTVPSLQEYYDCCTMSDKESCRQVCSDSLLAFNGNLSAIIPNIIDGCGPPPADPVWQCLLTIPSPTTPTPVVSTKFPVQPRYADWARIQCCYRARDNVCKDSCLDLYSGQVSASAWSTFQLDCIHRPDENSLSTCLADITSPCQLGCSGMQFCRNFNNRPAQFFRQCTTTADRLAKNNYYSWIHNGRILHPLVTILVGNVEECLSEAWKAVACFTNLQPCHSTTHATQICWADCIRLLVQCTNSSVTSEAICNIIAPRSSEGRCTSLNQFLQPSVYGNDIISPLSSMIDDPCDPNPCAEGFFCSINRVCNDDDQSCTPYECQPGCVIGTKPSIVVPKSAGVRVALVSHSRYRYHGYLNCSSTAEVDGDTRDTSDSDTAPSPILNIQCELEESCALQDRNLYGHKSKFWADCNFCTCFYGHLTCTNYTCDGSSISESDCGCTNEYAPVCTRDGITISNQCRAHCFGYEEGDYHIGDCGSVRACGNSGLTCGVGYRCIPQRQSCLSHNETQCLQFKCESLDQEACLQQSSPVCDVSNNQHNSLCSFLRTQEEFNYFGYCKSECSSSSSPVCGVNGETFASECHAHNVYVYVDYNTSCHPPISGFGLDRMSCSDVKCPDLAHSGCSAVVPRGACCPLCGTVITVLTDRTILQRNIQSMRMSSLSSLDIIRRLQYYIRYTQCELYGHVEVDGSLTLIVVPERNAMNLMVEVCHQEAIKLATFINNRTPILASDPFLSHFVAAHVTEIAVKETTSVTVPQPTTPSHCLKLVPNILFILLSIVCFHYF